MKKFLAILSLSILLATGQASACPFCYGAKDGKSAQHMAVAIWFLFGAVMSVIGGIGAPHQEINEEDLDKYDE